MPQVNIRVDRDAYEMLNKINPKPGTAGTTVINLFTQLRSATIAELRGRFTPAEIKALAEAYKWVKPSWALMTSPVAINFQLANAENLKSAISAQGVSIAQLTDKIIPLTSAQALILQLELISFWEFETPDVKTIVKALS